MTTATETSLATHIRVMKQLASVLGVEWRDDSDTHNLLVTAQRKAKQADEFKATMSTMQEVIAQHQS